MRHECLHNPDNEIDSETLTCFEYIDGEPVENGPCKGSNCCDWAEGVPDHFDLDKAEAAGDTTVVKRDHKEGIDVKPWPTKMPEDSPREAH